MDDDDGYALCKLGIDDKGLHYYRPKSRILTRQENARTRNTPHYYLTMEELKELGVPIQRLYDPLPIDV